MSMGGNTGGSPGVPVPALTLRMRLAAASPRRALRVARITRAPYRASSSAVAAPMPLLPPAERSAGVRGGKGHTGARPGSLPVVAGAHR